MRGVSTGWMVTYAILIVLVVAFLPGLISLNNSGLSQYDNKSDPSYIAVAAMPLIFFALYLFKPWRDTEGY